MALWDRVSQFLSLTPWHERTIDPFAPAPTMDQQLAALRVYQSAARPWRLPSISEALGVPAIQRAVTLISNTTGSLSIQGIRNGAPMDETPRIVARPDPYQTPRDFYRDAAYLMATRGEVVLWTASRDSNGAVTALIVVPPAELTVEDNPRNRLFPVYTWGRVKSTRYSAANPDGQFVHVTYLKEPGALRGSGPLQLSGAAASVAVEAQEWAANFYASGGYPSILLKSALDLNEAEAAALKEAWVSTPTNMPKVIDPGIEDVTEFGANPQSAQMLEAREFQNGDAARMFGIPGALMEFRTPGSSLTYQNLAEVWNDFVKGCLAPNYLEPLEQALTDLLPRSTVARFYVEGILRADIKTRYEVYKTGIESGVLDVAMAQQMEGIIPGSIETMPVPFAAPSATPASLPYERSGPVRCDGMHTKRMSGIPRLMRCNRLLAERGPFVGTCPRCKTVYEPPAAPEPSADDLAFRTLVASVAALVARDPAAPSITVNVPEQTANETPAILRSLAESVAALAAREQAPAQVTIAEGAVRVESPITVNNIPPVEPSREVEYDEAGRVSRLRVVQEGAA